MAYNNTKNYINIFNETYGTSVSLDRIQSEYKRLNSYNNALQVVFYDAYVTALLKDLCKKDVDFLNSQDMLKDFKRLVVNNLADEIPKEQKGTISKNMGLETKLTEYNMLEAIWKALPQNNVEVVATSYKNGNIRIRDMVAAAKSTPKYDDRTKILLVSYAEALKRVNESRSFWWRLNPLNWARNHAEKRDSKLIESLVKSKISEQDYKTTLTTAESKLANLDKLEQETISTVLHSNSKEIEGFKVDNFNGEYTYEQQQQFKEWLNKLNARHDAPANNADVIEQNKESVVVNDIKENVYQDNESNQKIEDDPAIKNNNLIV